jgi:hypothetical protein
LSLVKTHEREEARRLRRLGWSVREIEDFWLATLDLPRTCLRRSIVHVYSKYSQKKRRNKLPYGTCKIVYHDTRTMQSIYGAIQAYAGFDRPQWLD